MLWLKIILSIVIGYLLGNIQTGLLLAKKIAKVDLRTVGSGSTGATNTMRVLGTRMGLLTLLIDAAKGALATLIGLWIGEELCAVICGGCAAVGHVYPVLFGFHGGKGVAVTLGALAPLMPLYALIVIAVGVIVIALTRFVSMGSMTGAALYMVLGSIRAIRTGSVPLLLFSLLLPGLIIFAHRQNISRLLHGKENKISFDKK